MSTSIRRGLHSDRGVAILIVLLVTALLIALIFEFAYGTRVSLRGAVNFRDSQRAYFLARLGVTAFINYGDQLRKGVPQGQWQAFPSMGATDTEVSVKWEDETGKIRINDVKTISATTFMVRNLFESVKNIDTAVCNRLTSDDSKVYGLGLLSGLHEFMNDEEYNKVSNFLTVIPAHKINVNTASSEVLQSMGITVSEASTIITERQTTPYTQSDLTSTGKISLIIGNKQILGQNVTNYLTTDPSGYYKIFVYVSVGDYKKQVEAIINGNAISYWRVM